MNYLPRRGSQRSAIAPPPLRHGWPMLRQLWQSQSGAAAMIQTLGFQVLILATNMATGILTARSLGPEGRGMVAAMMVWPQLLTYLLTLGLPAAIIFNVKRYPKLRSHLFTAALMLALLLGGVAAIVGIVFLPQWLSHYGSETIYRAQVLMVLSPVSLLSIVLIAFCEVEGRFRLSNQSKYWLPTATLLGILALIAGGWVHPITVVLVYTLPSVVITGWLFRQIAPQFQPTPFDWQRTQQSGQQLLQYGLRCYGIDLLKVLSDRLLGQALVIGLLSPTAMGLYTVAYSISRMLNLFEQAVISVLVPKTSARPVGEIAQLTSCTARVTTTLTVLCVIPLMALCPFFLQLLYGAEFLGAVPVFRWLLLEVTLGGTTWVLAQAFIAAGKPGIITIFQGIGVGLSMPLLLYCVPRFGLVGIGYALMLTTTIRFVFVLLAYPWILQQPLPSLLISLQDIRFIRQKLAR